MVYEHPSPFFPDFFQVTIWSINTRTPFSQIVSDPVFSHGNPTANNATRSVSLIVHTPHYNRRTLSEVAWNTNVHQSQLPSRNRRVRCPQKSATVAGASRTLADLRQRLLWLLHPSWPAERSKLGLGPPCILRGERRAQSCDKRVNDSELLFVLLNARGGAGMERTHSFVDCYASLSRRNTGVWGVGRGAEGFRAHFHLDTLHVPSAPQTRLIN